MQPQLHSFLSCVVFVFKLSHLAPSCPVFSHIFSVFEFSYQKIKMNRSHICISKFQHLGFYVHSKHC